MSIPKQRMRFADARPLTAKSTLLIGIVLAFIVTLPGCEGNRTRSEAVAFQERSQTALEVVLAQAFGSGALTEWTEVVIEEGRCMFSGGSALTSRMTLEGQFELRDSFEAFREAWGDAGEVSEILATGVGTYWGYKGRGDAMHASGDVFWDQGVLTVVIGGQCYQIDD